MKNGINRFKTHFVPPGRTAESLFKWKRMDAEITDHSGRVYFSMKSVEAPENWSDLAVEIAASKYFRKVSGQQEKSIRKMVARVTSEIVQAGRKQKIFKTSLEQKAFSEELKYILLSQRAFFNSPVWFNCGVLKDPQVSACFIQSLSDDLDGIYELLKNEGRIFKFGSGSGTNFSVLRSKYEDLAQGGKSSGLMSFLDLFDAAAGSIKSGGTTRRAAKMVCVDADHPEILEFISWKAHEEKKAQALIREGYPSDYEGEAYRTVSGQNANNSVRVTDAFMKAVSQDRPWALRSRTTGKKMSEIPAKEIWQNISQAAWECADPGLQFDDTIQRAHTCAAIDRIKASNPCSEYMFLDDTACNLASLNLLQFQKEDGSFDLTSYLHTIEIIFTAQEILVGLAGYPTEKIAKNSREFRPLGIGLCGLGALLMRRGIAYDSNEGRAWGAALAALLQGQAALVSAKLAKNLGAFSQFKKVKSGFLRVIKKHKASLKNIEFQSLPSEFATTVRGIWDQALAMGTKFGFRNAQFTVMAPTGTIGLVMDCDTTGIEPEYALLRQKKLTGGGDLKLISQSVGPALAVLGYNEMQRAKILKYLEENSCLEGAPKLKVEHYSVFDCAQKNGSKGERFLTAEAHLQMMAAIQPFLSGAISKTVNLPNSVSALEIGRIYRRAWELGLKSISIYRDGCKLSQPLNKTDYPNCAECGGPTELVGGCYRCGNCGFTTGCIS